MTRIILYLTLSIALNLDSSEKIKLDTPLDEGAQYGWAVDLSGDFIAIGGPGYYYSNNQERHRCGTVLIFQKNSKGDYTFLQRLLPPAPSVRGYFGGSIAMHKNDLLVGDALDKLDPRSNASTDRAGAVYAYKYDEVDRKWRFVNKIVKADRTTNDSFGDQVALNDNIGIISTSGKGKGGLFVIKKNANEAWDIISSFREGLSSVREIDLNANNLIFASDIDLSETDQSNSKKWKVVTATIDCEGRLSNFKVVKPQRSPEGRKFGKYALQISDDYCFVSSYYELNNGDRLSHRGNVHVFHLDNSSGEWNEIQKVVSPDINKGDFFGSAMDFESGNLVVGAMGDNYNETQELMEYRGSAYIYRLESDSLILKSKIPAPNKEWNKFGFSVAIDQETVLIGSRLESYGDTMKNAGGAYTFGLD